MPPTSELGRHRVLADVLVRNGDRRVADERRPPGQQLEEQAAGGVDVRAGVDLLALGLLGREVLRGADDGLGLGHRGRAVGDGPGDAEVHDLDRAGRGQHHVGRLDVAVHDAHAVAVLQRREHAGRDPQRLGPVQRPGLAEQVAHGAALDVLHDDVRRLHGRAAGLLDDVLTAVVDRDDGRMVQGRGGLGLAAEPLVELRVPGQVGAQHLDRDAAAEAGVVADVDLGHPAATEQLAHLVASAQQAGGVAHVVPSCSLSRSWRRHRGLIRPAPPR